MSPVEKFFTGRFLNLYGAPEAGEAAAFIGEYTKALDGTDAAILEEASNKIVKQHKYRNWPTVGECVAAVESAALRRARERELAAGSRPLRRTGPEPTTESRARVAAMVGATVAKLRVVDAADKRPFSTLRPVDRDAWERMFGKAPS